MAVSLVRRGCRLPGEDIGDRWRVGWNQVLVGRGFFFLPNLDGGLGFTRRHGISGNLSSFCRKRLHLLKSRTTTEPFMQLSRCIFLYQVRCFL